MSKGGADGKRKVGGQQARQIRTLALGCREQIHRRVGFALLQIATIPWEAEGWLKASMRSHRLARAFFGFLWKGSPGVGDRVRDC